MPNRYVADEIARMLVNAVNLWLRATGSPLRVRGDGITVTYRDGILLMAFYEER